MHKPIMYNRAELNRSRDSAMHTVYDYLYRAACYGQTNDLELLAKQLGFSDSMIKIILEPFKIAKTAKD